jgi:hypothetical protein
LKSFISLNVPLLVLLDSDYASFCWSISESSFMSLLLIEGVVICWLREEFLDWLYSTISSGI